MPAALATRAAASTWIALNEAARDLGQHADQVYDPIGALDSAIDRGIVGHRGMQRHDLPDPPGGSEEHRPLGVTDRDPHGFAGACQQPNHIPADGFELPNTVATSVIATIAPAPC